MHLQPEARQGQVAATREQEANHLWALEQQLGQQGDLRGGQEVGIVDDDELRSLSGLQLLLET